MRGADPFYNEVNHSEDEGKSFLRDRQIAEKFSENLGLVIISNLLTRSGNFFIMEKFNDSSTNC